MAGAKKFDLVSLADLKGVTRFELGAMILEGEFEMTDQVTEKQFKDAYKKYFGGEL